MNEINGDGDARQPLGKHADVDVIPRVNIVREDLKKMHSTKKRRGTDGKKTELNEVSSSLAAMECAADANEKEFWSRLSAGNFQLGISRPGHFP